MRRQPTSVNGEKVEQTIHRHDPEGQDRRSAGSPALSFIQLDSEQNPPASADFSGIVHEGFPHFQSPRPTSNDTGSFYADSASLLASAEEVVEQADEDALGWEQLSPAQGVCENMQTQMMYDETGFIDGLRHHRIKCHSNQFLSRWRFSRASTSNKLLVYYTCCTMSQSMGTCHMQGSKWTHEAKGHLTALTKHDVECRGNRALNRWHAEFNLITRRLRVDYACCDLPDTQAFGGCQDKVTPKTPLSNSILDFTRHDARCPTSHAMTRWRYVKSSTQMWIEYTCCAVGRVVRVGTPSICSWVGDPHFLTFDHSRVDPVGPGDGIAYWVVRSKYISVQSYYQGLGMYEPAYTRAVAVSGSFLKNHKFVIAKDVKYLHNANPAYRKSMATKIFWDSKEVSVGSGFKSLGNGLVTIQKTGVQYRIHFPWGVSLRVNAYSFYLDSFLRMGVVPGGQDGQCGSHNHNVGDDNSKRLAYNSSLAVKSSENLFLLTTTQKAFKTGGKTLSQCSRAKRRAAWQKCKGRFKGKGIIKDLISACIYDECFNGDQDAGKTDAEAEVELRAMFELEKPRDIIVTGHARSWGEAKAVCAALGYEIYKMQSKVEHAAAWQAVSLKGKTVTKEVFTGGHFTGGKWQWHDGSEVCDGGFKHWQKGHGKSTNPTHKYLCLHADTGLWAECGNHGLKNVLCAKPKAYGSQGMSGPNGARVACGLGKSLAMPKSKTENDALLKELKKDMSSGLAFLGARYDASYGWLWDDGSSVCGYTNWAAGEPSLGQKDEVMLWMCIDVSTGKWKSCKSSPAKLVACETQMENVRCPEPLSVTTPAKAKFCAKEGGSCSCSGTAFYGTFAASVPRKELISSGFKTKPSRGSIRCNTASFGDPHHGFRKFCYCQEVTKTSAKFCAKENQWCKCAGTVYFGGKLALAQVKELARNSFRKKTSVSSVTCSHKVFGDPAPFYHKTCLCQKLSSTTADFCAKEGGTCSCSGTVWYGVIRSRVLETELMNNGFVSKPLSGSLWCKNNVFGDPHHGYHKNCYCQSYKFLDPTFCAKENGLCKCAGNIWYGGKFSSGVKVQDLQLNQFAERPVSGSVRCGGNGWRDPKAGWHKHCYCMTDQEPGKRMTVDHKVEHFMNHCYYLGRKGEDCHQTCARTVNGFCDHRGLDVAAKSTQACKLILTGFGGLITPKTKVNMMSTDNSRLGCSVVQSTKVTQVIVDRETWQGHNLGPRCGDSSDNINQRRVCSCSTTEEYDYPPGHVMLENDKVRIQGSGMKPAKDFTIEVTGKVLKSWMRQWGRRRRRRRGVKSLLSVNADGSVEQLSDINGTELDAEDEDEEQGVYAPSLEQEDDEADDEDDQMLDSGDSLEEEAGEDEEEGGSSLVEDDESAGDEEEGDEDDDEKEGDGESLAEEDDEGEVDGEDDQEDNGNSLAEEDEEEDEADDDKQELEEGGKSADDTDSSVHLHRRRAWHRRRRWSRRRGQHRRRGGSLLHRRRAWHRRRRWSRRRGQHRRRNIRRRRRHGILHRRRAWHRRRRWSRRRGQHRRRNIRRRRRSILHRRRAWHRRRRWSRRRGQHRRRVNIRRRRAWHRRRRWSRRRGQHRRRDTSRRRRAWHRRRRWSRRRGQHRRRVRWSRRRRLRAFRRRYAGMVVKVRLTGQVSRKRILWQMYRFNYWSKTRTILDWPFTPKLKAGDGMPKSWSVDFRKGKRLWELYVNGNRLPFVDYWAKGNVAFTGVSTAGVSSASTVLLPNEVSDFESPVSYYTDNGCVRFPHSFKSDVVTWEFKMNLAKTKGRHCLRCEEVGMKYGNNVMIKDGYLEVSINNNAPRKIRFSRKFLANSFYNVSVVYTKVDKTVQLYLDHFMIEQKHFSRATTATMTKAHVGCYFDHLTVDGTILRMRTLPRTPDYRRKHGYCAEFKGCREGTHNRDDAFRYLCKGPVCMENTDQEICCAPAAKCSSYQCPQGEVLTPKHATTHCAGTSCQYTDRAKCCVKASTCATLTCPAGMGHRPYPGETFCAGGCDIKRDLDLCCIKTNTCGTYACPTGFTTKDGMGKVPCKHHPCNKQDEAICCVKQGMCSSYKCPAGYAQKANAAAILCEDATCKDTPFSTCCVEIGKCSSMTCPNTMVRSSTVVGTDMYCSTRVCSVKDTSRCCTPKATCDTYRCPFHMVLKPNAKSLHCIGHHCHAVDTETCCTHKGHCSAFKCPKDYSLRATAADTLCADAACKNTDYHRCCADNGKCDSLTCPSGYLIKFNASSIPCKHGLCKVADDRDLCCEKRATCNSMLCPYGKVQKAGASSIMCAKHFCDRSDTDTCCVPAGSCTAANCPIGYHLRADAATRICKTAHCDDSDYRHCCDKSNSCNTYLCPAGFILRPDAVNTTCIGARCGTQDLHACCERRQHCAGYSCPKGLAERPDSASILCAAELCHASDAGTCCQKEGYCESFQCPEEHVHRLNAANIPCDDHACNHTDFHKCCVPDASCLTYKCPSPEYTPHPGAPRNCSTWQCTDKDRDLCCVPSATCASFTCPVGKALRASPDKLHCKSHMCGLNDIDTCCENVGMCATFQCPEPAWMHKADKDKLMCADANCKDTDYRVCCAEAGSCATLKCPEHTVPRDASLDIRCANLTCTDEDVNACCDQREPCSNFHCPDGMHAKHNVQELFCAGKSCGALDAATCCATEDHCDSMACPHGYVHRFDARTTPCNNVTCETTPFEKCCIRQSSCLGFMCPTPNWVLRPDADRVFCAGWTCSEVDIPMCCEHVADCRNMICHEPLVLRASAQRFPCKEAFCSQEDEKMCCVHPGTCAAYSCPSAYLHKQTADQIPCHTADCALEEVDHCCVLKHECTSMTCPVDMVLRDEAHLLPCHGYECGEMDVHTCCLGRAKCFSATCPPGTKHKANATILMCANQSCTAADSTACCEAEDTCSGYECPLGWGLKADAAMITCGEHPCIQVGYDHCCEKLATCENYMCPYHKVEKTKIDLGTVLCSGDECEELCCDEKATCSLFKCPEHYVHKAVNFTFCSSSACGEADLHECCTLQDRCAAMECPDGLVHRHNAHELICPDHECTEADKDMCCVEATSCLAHECPYGMAHHVNDKGEHGLCHSVPCSEEDDANCCGIAQTCATFSCPSGFTLRNQSAFIFCENMECDNDVDLHNCCADMSTCAGFDCMTDITGLVHRWDAHDIPCSGGNCSDSCCVAENSCSGFACPAGFARDPNAAEITCDGRCTDANVGTCCAEDGKCSSLMCPPDYIPKPGYLELHCSEKVCTSTDVHLCCDHRANCGAFTCPEGTERLAGNETLCAGATCNELVDANRCCTPRAECGSYTFMCEEGMVSARGSDALCKSASCTPEDRTTCCVPRATCHDMHCPDGWRAKSPNTAFCAYKECNYEEDLKVCCEVDSHQGSP